MQEVGAGDFLLKICSDAATDADERTFGCPRKSDSRLYLRTDLVCTGWSVEGLDHHIHEKHWYLFVLGVAPHHQGQRLGGRLVSKMSEKADLNAMPCYLETDRPENINFYKSQGYQLIGEEFIPSLDNLKIWYMMRPAIES